jgi:proline dehydrogenase
MPLNFDNTEIAFSSKTNSDLLKARFLFSSMAKPWLTKLGIQLTQFAFKLHLPIHHLIKVTIFKQFCGGETLSEADKTSIELSKYGVGVIMDYGVEGKSDEVEFEKTTESFIKTILFAKDKPHIPFISLKITGFARFELLEKLQSKKLLTPDETAEAQRILKRVDKICHAAADHQKMILIDAEESWIQQPVDDLANQMMAKYNTKNIVVYNTFQLYRHDRLAFLKQSFEHAKAGQYLLGAKLVRGAYMEKERLRALKKNYPDPIQPNKEATDRDYDLAMEFCLNHLDQLSLFIGTHNENSCMLATQIMRKQSIPEIAEHIYFSQLFGMSDNISFNLAKRGYHVSKYLPYGPVEDVIPYLMRRAQENTSVAGQTSRELTLINKELERRKLLTAK